MRPPGSQLRQAQAHFEAGRFEEAATLCKKLAKAQPRSSQPLHLLAMCQTRLLMSDDALRTIRKAARLDPDSVPLLVDHAKILQSLERFDEAEAKLREAIARDPDFPYALSSLAMLLIVVGRHDEAVELVLDGIERHPDDTALVFAYARIAARAKRVDHAIELLEQRLEVESAPSIVSEIHIRLANLYEKRGDYDLAWENCERGNEVIDPGFNADAHAEETDRLITSWSPDAIRRLPKASNSTDLPVFVVGMPRSGTSLVEQIIASHPRAHGCGELLDLNLIARDIRGPGPTRIPMISDTKPINKQLLDRMQRRYLRTLLLAANGADRVTDKLPDNGFHIGLISRMLPGARVIRTRRSPVDIAISCYFRKFMGHQAWPYNPESIADFMRDNERVLDHYVEHLDAPILEVEYERLVADPEPQIRRILDFLDLEWNEACLEFHKSDRVVTTNSNEQVRRPMYTSEINKAARFGDRARPLLDALESRGLIEPSN